MSGFALPAGFVPDADGFVSWRSPNLGDFNTLYGEIRARREGDKVRCRVETGPSRGNAMGTIHGGFTLAYLDQLLFVTPALLGLIEIGGAVTVSTACQFVGAGTLDRPLDGVTEIVAETGRMLFLRGVIEQDGRATAAFEGVLRKLSGRPGTPTA